MVVESGVGESVVAVLEQHAIDRGERVAFTWLSEGDSVESSLTYRDLARRAREIAGVIVARTAPGDRVLLLFTGGLDFIVGFFGCLYSGRIAVPTYPPQPARLDRTLPRLRRIVQDSQPSVVLTTHAISGLAVPMRGAVPELDRASWIVIDRLDAHADPAGLAMPRSDAIAFLQYTSGSTGAPKGVVLTHANLVHNERLIREGFAHGDDAIVVGWLPLFHDMGLIGNVLQPIVLGAHCVLMAPEAFLRKPMRWLHAISRYRATTSGGPNFAYDLCARKATAEDLASLDLRSWGVAFNGAEPIRPETLDRFAAAFAPAGFDRNAFYPCYGLAEATLIVTGSRVGAGPVLADDVRRLVGCGARLGDQQVIVVDPESLRQTTAGAEGEIWVSGASVAKGYWRAPELTAATFAARAHGVDGEFLRTGDLGFVRDGELFVTGRRKDLIIIRGENHYPQDIEHTVEGAWDAVRPGCVAAFSLATTDGEGVGIVAEIDPRKAADLDVGIRTVRTAVANAHELSCATILLVGPGDLYKTSSGKIQRGTCRDAFLADKFRPIARWSDERQAVAADAGDVHPIIALVAQRCHQPVTAFAPDTRLSSLGIDSLGAAELEAELEIRLGVVASMSELLGDLAVGDLIARFDNRSPSPAPNASPAPAEVLNALTTISVTEESLTIGQRALWFLWRLDPDATAYQIARVVRIRGVLDAGALERTILQLSERHPALRTTFHARDHGPVRSIGAAPNLVQIDARGWTAEALRDAIAIEARQTIDLAAGPPVRWRLWQLGADDHILSLVGHHIVLDLWSIGILLEEIDRIYTALVRGGMASLARSGDFDAVVRRERDYLTSPSADRAFSYWKAQLAGVPVLELPADRPRPRLQSYRGGAHRVRIDRGRAAALLALGAGAHATPFMTLLALHWAWLRRYSGQPEVVVGSPSSGRNAESERVVGYLVNPLALRLDAPESASFAQLIATARRSCLDAYEHRHVPFAEVVERLRLPRDPSRSPIFQTWFALQRALGDAALGRLAVDDTGAELALGGLAVEGLPLEQRAAQFDLSLLVADADGELVLLIEYNTDLFDRSTIEQMGRHLDALVSAVVARPDVDVAALPMLSPVERAAAIDAARSTHAPIDVSAGAPLGATDSGIDAWFERQAAARAGAIAVVAGAERWTYEQLDHVANKIAHALRAAGVRRGDRVALLLERSPEQVAAVLGVLKAGAAYVPLEPDLPVDRLGFLLRDCGARVVISEAYAAPLAREAAPAAVVLRLDEARFSARADGVTRAPEDHRAVADDVAYIIYTSGSTGAPKGVAVSHRNVARLFSRTERIFHFSPDDVWTLFHSYAFDFSVWELFGALLYGGRLVIVPKDVSRAPDRFFALIVAERVTVLNQTPSAFGQLVGVVESLGTGAPEVALRWIVFGGEALDFEILRPWFELYGDAHTQLGNMYGITETTVHVTFRQITAGDLERRASAIGRPIDDLEVHVLDAYLEPVPVGVVGEIYVGGAGLAVGYHGQSALTAARFVPDPFSSRPGARLYRSGDVGRRLADGDVVYLGRADQQVKIRGFRIELGEIEAALLAHPGVRETHVLAMAERAGLRLVAYLVARAGAAPTAPELRQHLRKQLPDYMVPSGFVVLPWLPLTRNGKLDRAALPESTRAPVADERIDLPIGDEEQALLEIWSELLAAGPIGLDDNFFEIGGHSLLATQVVSRVRDRFGVSLPVSAVFEGPTIAELSRALRSAALRSTTAGATQIRALPRGADAPPLSFAQQRLWLLDRLEPGTALYNSPGAIRIDGALDADRLEQALQLVIDRHETLRTMFIENGGIVAQAILPQLAIPLLRIDLTAMDPESREREIARRSRTQMLLPFDLAGGPLLRATLYRLAPDVHVLHLVAHHIVVDVWSVGVFFRELSEGYAALAAGRAVAWPALPIQYSDFAIWQRRLLASGDLETQRAYWKARLASPPPTLALPIDRPRVSRQRHGAHHRFVLDRELGAAVARLAVAEDASPYMTLLAAFGALLEHYCREQDLAIGTPIANRHRTELEPLIGFFVNTLVLRLDTSGRPTFRERVRRARATALEAFEHQDLPFEVLVEELNPTRDLGRSPFFDVMFSFENAPSSDLALPGATVSWSELPAETSKFDLTLSVRPNDGPDGGLLGTFEYDADLFEARTIERMVGHLRRLIDRGVARPDQDPLDGALLDETERRTLVLDWNATEQAFDSDVLLHERVERQAERSPDVLALRAGQDEITYRELNERANQLARRLVASGVGAEVRVAVCFERSVDLIVAIVATLKAGGAYVVLDPEYPAERLAVMLDVARPAWIMTASALRGRLPATATPTFELDTRRAELAAFDHGNLVRRAAPDNLAYVIFTSGSTGRPKAVMTSHRAVGNYLHAMQQRFPLSTGDRALQMNATSFDASVSEVFTALQSGALLVLPQAGEQRDAAATIATIGASRITTIQVVPSMLRALLDEPSIREARSLTRVFCGGEALPLDTQRALAKALDVELVNLYGPTEATIDPAFEVCPSEGTRSIVPVGRPNANMRIYVLDDALQLVPIGVPGEAYFGGVGLARGYLGDPRMTADRFVPDPHGGESGGRLYRSGDLVRTLADGRIEFLGRLDHQVKIRGHRIELEDVEAALARHPAVKACAVVVREDVPGDRRLIAYVVTTDIAPTAALREQMRELVPDFMVPSAFVPLAALPLSPNGKVDRRALPAPDAQLTADAYVPPATATEAAVVACFAEVLRLPRASVEDDFFALGGHSLLATQVVARLRTAFGIELPLRALFEAPTPRGLAERVDAAHRVEASAIVPIARDRELELSFAQQRLWFFEQLDPGSALYNISSALRIRGPLDVGVLARVFHEIVRRHEALRCVFLAREGRAVSGIAPTPQHWPLPVIRIAAAWPEQQDAEIDAAIRADAALPFDLSAGPLLRTSVLHVAPDDHVLLVAMHHIVADGWSVGLLVREVSALYAAFASGHPSPLPELPVQYPDFAAHQRRSLDGDEMARELAYWKAQLADPPQLEFQTDRARSSARARRSGRHPVTIPPDLVDAIRRVGLARDATLFMTVLAAFQVLLSRWAGQTDLCVGTPVANRNSTELEPLIGFFVNTLVLRADLSGAPRFVDFLERVRETALGAYANQSVPFERVVDALGVPRDLGKTPLVQVMFGIQDAPRFDLAGLQVTPLPSSSGLAKFDLDLTFTEYDGALVGHLEYDAGMFAPASVARMARSFLTLLDAIVCDRECPVDALPLLDPAERRDLILGWNDTIVARPAARVHELFEAQAARTPDAIAVSAGERRLSYRTLNERANRLARHLRALGVGPESLVGVCLERSPELLIGLLGILKSGAAYVPIEPSYPSERIAMLLDNSRVAVLVTLAVHRDRLRGGSLGVVCLDNDATALAEHAEHNLGVAVAHDHLAYVIYTSGSTGVPNGVLVHHGGLANYVRWAAARFGVGLHSRVLEYASPAFDAHAEEIYPALCHGGSVVVATEDARLAPEAFIALCERERITFTTLPTAFWHTWVDALERLPLPTALRCVVIGGEAAREEQVERWRALVGDDVVLLNTYGPTETTVVATSADLVAADGVPIGRPIDNTQCYVLDGRGNPVPVGVPGELYIGGAGVSRGYLRAGLTADRFTPDPFGTSGGRIYRTGDRVRWLASGDLDFLGRTEAQLKVRGFRIHPGEVEAHLRAQPQVRDAVVGVRDDVPGGRQLVAYIVLVAGERDATSADVTSALRVGLRKVLPEYMIPSAYAFIEGIPLTPTGKVDRRTLAKTAFSAGAVSHADRPRPGIEERIAAIWRAELGLEHVGRDDSFFDVGGTSLLAVRVRFLLEQAFACELPIVTLFQYPTIADIAAHLGGDAGPDDEVREDEVERARDGQRRLARLRSRKSDE